MTTPVTDDSFLNGPVFLMWRIDQEMDDCRMKNEEISGCLRIAGFLNRQSTIINRQ
jgi:hypothetical protein